MSTRESPEFEGDEQAKPASSAPPPKPAVTAKGGAALGGAKAPGIKEEGTKPPPLSGASGPVDFEFEASEEPPPRRPAALPPSAAATQSDPPTARTTVPMKGGRSAAPAPSAPVDESVDPDLAPGSRKDLWNCPHCGAGNRPGRPTCRTCGKSPDDPVARSWTRNPLVVGGIAVAAVVVLVVLFRALTTVDLSCKEPNAQHIDKAVRRGGHGENHTVQAGDFTGKSKVAVCGVVIGFVNDPRIAGAVKAVLALGPGAVDAAAAAQASFSDDDVSVSGLSGAWVVTRLMTDGAAPKLAKGEIVSLTGDLGQVEGNNPNPGDLVIYVTECRTGQ
jgi:hypothetical protein